MVALYDIVFTLSKLFTNKVLSRKYFNSLMKNEYNYILSRLYFNSLIKYEYNCISDDEIVCVNL